MGLFGLGLGFFYVNEGNPGRQGNSGCRHRQALAMRWVLQRQTNHPPRTGIAIRASSLQAFFVPAPSHAVTPALRGITATQPKPPAPPPRGRARAAAAPAPPSTDRRRLFEQAPAAGTAFGFTFPPAIAGSRAPPLPALPEAGSEASTKASSSPAVIASLRTALLPLEQPLAQPRQTKISQLCTQRTVSVVKHILCRAPGCSESQRLLLVSGISSLMEPRQGMERGDRLSFHD